MSPEPKPKPSPKIQDIFSMVLFCFLVLMVSYMGWNFVQALIAKFA